MNREQAKCRVSCLLKCFVRRRMIAGMGTSPDVLTAFSYGQSFL